MGTCVRGYGYCDPIPIPVLRNEYFFSFYIPVSLPVLLMGFHLPRRLVMGTHCHPYTRLEGTWRLGESSTATACEEPNAFLFASGERK
jgi:hypothetical protein